MKPDGTATLPGRTPATRTTAPRAAYPAGRGYSLFVSWSKRLLPAIAVALLLLIAAWPRLQLAMHSIEIALPRLDLREARELRMVNARYSGVDRQNRPFLLTADTAKQAPRQDDAVTLDTPKADLTATSGSWLELSSATGLYQPQPQLLDLFGDVQFYQDKGNEFHSASAHIDMAAGSADSNDPVTGQGPFGTVRAEGFSLLNRGETIIFKGHTVLDIVPAQREAK